MYRYSALNFFMAMVAITQAMPDDMFVNELYASQLRGIFGVEDLNDAPEYEVIYPQVVTSEGNYGINTEAIAEDSLNINVKAFGETLHLTVHKDNSLFSPDFYVEEISSDGEPRVPVQVRQDCLYTGKVTSEPDSMVSLSTLSGLAAIIYHANGPTYIDPLDAEHINDRGRPHIAYKKDENRTFKCDVADSHQGMEFQVHSSDAVHVNEKKTMELAIFIDSKAFTNNGILVINNLLVTLSMVQGFFRDPSLGTVLEINIKCLFIYVTLKPGFSSDISSSVLLAADEQYSRNPKGDSNPGHWDNALFLTGHKDPNRYGVRGVAFLAPCTTTKYAVALVEFGGAVETAQVIAHELGHNLGMRHDGDSNECSSSGFIMALSGVGGTKWSACSKEYFMNTLLETTCFDD